MRLVKLHHKSFSCGNVTLLMMPPRVHALIRRMAGGGGEGDDTDFSHGAAKRRTDNEGLITGCFLLREQPLDL